MSKVMLKRNCLCSIKMECPFHKVRKKTKKALRESGFEVINEINFSEFVKSRLGIQINRYLILEILNPYTAFQFLLAELQAGLFIPFRIVIYEDNAESTTVSFLDPEEATSLGHNEILKLIAREASKKLMDTLAGIQESV